MGTFEDIASKLKGTSILANEDFDFGYFDSGSYALNKVLSGDYTKGYKVGTLNEICGESSSAKTVFLTQAFIGAQKEGHYCIMLDNEHSYSKDFAEAQGVDTSKLLYTDEPETIEQCFDFIESVIKEIRKVDKTTPILIGFDSIGSTPSDKDMEGSVGDRTPMDGAQRALVTGKALQRLGHLLMKEKATVILINQYRQKVGVMFGDDRSKAGGGKSLKYYCATSNDTLSAGTGPTHIRNDAGKVIGITGKISNKKNKVAFPYQECTFELYFDKGLTRTEGLLEVALKEGDIIKVEGSRSYKFTEESDDSKLTKDKMIDALVSKIENGELK